MSFSISMFGRFRIFNGHETISALQQRRAQELFSYLLLHQNHSYPRETLASLLWEDADPTQARKYLRQALWQIQTALQNIGGDAAKELLTLDAEWIRLNTVECISLDVAHFEQAVDACQGTDGVNLSDAQCEKLEQAVQLYCGDLLEGWYQDWCIFERERLQNRYLTALDKLVVFCSTQGSVDCGLMHAERMLRLDPAEEQAHYHIMHLHWIAGHRTKAMRQYQSCKKILLQELDIRPSERTTKLYDRIRADEVDPLPSNETASKFSSAQLDVDKLMGCMTCLQQQQAHLLDLADQLKRDMHAMVLALKNQR